jgi:hypothetical protein
MTLIFRLIALVTVAGLAATAQSTSSKAPGDQVRSTESRPGPSSPLYVPDSPLDVVKVKGTLDKVDLEKRTVTISSKKFDKPFDLTFPQPRGREQVKASKKMSKQLGKSKLTLEDLDELKEGAKISLQYYPMLDQVMELVIEEPGG